MKNKKTKVILAAVAVLLLLQFVRPNIGNQHPATSPETFPNEVAAILQRSCYDCHSNTVHLRWFDQITPVNWLVADHVKRGRSVLNFSLWDKMEKPEQAAKLWESVNQVIAGVMPLESYTSLHPDAKITASDLQVLKKYVVTLAPKQQPDSAKNKTLETQYAQWAASTKNVPAKLPEALNGVQYIPGYKDWTPISTTLRVDNGTIRIIYGNDIAVEAIRQHQTNPWPNGSILAKVAWDQLTTAEGNITAGAFKQVEYMIKDKEKYASTEGWGWARFKTPALKPYGTSALFTTECINCHRPVKNNDFVFTAPIQH
ncbi:Cytochrome P460 [Chitinophaga eiseniae]|uniref:Cytochrome P460 n=1 Tax=Chitinophaga eiseniae TaxID=634771 RepID=A0A1T4SZ93_9BACT|nr:heme-binding domain-containing protein [Chitinophaga eiseniae]SKA33281.1 Cytochrome P460 [Chitinophaga eiseniae]